MTDTENMMNKRIEWIDAAKGLALLAVMWGHLIEGMTLKLGDYTGVNGWTALVILYSFNLPVFWLGLLLPVLVLGTEDFGYCQILV